MIRSGGHAVNLGEKRAADQIGRTFCGVTTTYARLGLSHMQHPETYIMTIRSGDEIISPGFKAVSDADARSKANEILAMETRRVGRTAVVTLSRLDGTPVVSARPRR